MIPETTALKLLFLELNSKRKLIGYVQPDVFSLFTEAQVTMSQFSFELYHPVEAHPHMLTRDFFDAAEKKYPGTGIRAVMGRDRKMVEQLDANAEGASSPLIRYYNDMQDRGPMWRMYYVYLAGCDYAKPEEPMVLIQSAAVEVAFPYKEEADQQLKILYDAEIRNIDPAALPSAVSSAPNVDESFRNIPVPTDAIMPGQPIVTRLLGGKPGDERYSVPNPGVGTEDANAST